jgi:3'-phosphoadenosine 5'-phosphosulfate sulfotransferase (PAPS reductase)/FAD synthetase
MDLYDEFADTLLTLVPDISNRSILLSCSAGKDSMAMLDLFLRFRRQAACRWRFFILTI